jgi:non-ribosomal peptide synthetase component F
MHSAQLHRNQDHQDRPLLSHINELISKLDALGIPSTPADETDENGDESDGWESAGGSTDDDGDVEMQ